MCRWVALPPGYPKDGRALYSLLVQAQEEGPHSDFAGYSYDRGIGMAFVRRGEFCLDKHSIALPIDRTNKKIETDFIRHLPHDGWTIIHHRYGNTYYGNGLEHLHPWVYWEWCTLQNGYTYVKDTVRLEYKVSVKGSVDSEVMACLIGKVGPDKAAQLAPPMNHSTTVSLRSNGELVINSSNRGQVYRDPITGVLTFATSIQGVDQYADGYLPGANGLRVSPIANGLTYL